MALKKKERKIVPLGESYTEPVLDSTGMWHNVQMNPFAYYRGVNGQETRKLGLWEHVRSYVFFLSLIDISMRDRGYIELYHAKKIS